MTEKQKPEYDIVKKAAQAVKDPKSATPTDIKRFASRILIDEKNASFQNKTVPKLKPKPK